MGLTIQYSLRSSTRSISTASHLVDELHQRAKDLPFQQIGDVLEFDGDDCDFNRRADDDPHRWLLIQARETVVHVRQWFDVRPSHIIAFETFPGDGCEPANFGLCSYPSFIMMAEGKRLRTGLSGWTWRSFCKTQYASNPAYGGVEHFLRCHLSVIKLLDHAKELGILNSVSDEGNFWEKREVKALAGEVGEWNEMIAGGLGRLAEMFGLAVEAPITAFPGFEHLEARGEGEANRTSL